MKRDKTDEQLLAEHLKQVRGAFDELVARYVREIYGFLYRFVGDAAAAEDLTQETFLQVHLAAESFDPKRRLRPWLYTIAANKARDYLRARGRRPELSLDVRVGDDEGPTPGEQLSDAQASALDQVEADEQRARVRAVVARMPEHLRMMLILGYYQQLPYAQIAEILGIPVGTVKSRLHAAVQHFARLWRAETEQASARRGSAES